MTRHATFTRSTTFGLFVVALIAVALLATSFQPAEASREGRRNTAIAIIGGLALLSALTDNDNHHRHYSNCGHNDFPRHKQRNDWRHGRRDWDKRDWDRRDRDRRDWDRRDTRFGRHDGYRRW